MDRRKSGKKSVEDKPFWPEVLLEALYERGKERKYFLTCLASEYSSKSDSLLKIFWIVLNEEHELWGKSSVGIREGWTVVFGKSKSEAPPDFDEFMRKLLGGGRP